MKLRNKKTGEIHEISSEISVLLKDSILNGTNTTWTIDDKERWYINENGGVLRYIPDDPDGEDLCYMSCQDAIGNHFKSKEEAEKAVEKLKAWERLKDNGFKFEGIKEDYTRILQNQDPFRTGKRYLQFNKSEDEEWMKENWQDLHLLFSGEDD